MPLYRRSELQSFLTSLGRGAKRTLSQNFLVDGNIVEKIVSLTTISKGTIIEIGPGPGVLTEAFLQKGCNVVAIELDSDFAKNLQRLETDSQVTLEVLEKDIRDVSLQALIERLYGNNEMAHIVSNLPYHLTKEILLAIAMDCRHPCEAILMVQEEVAKKLTQNPVSDSFLSMQLHLFGDIQYCARVPKGCFYPEPKVDSAILKFSSHVPLICDSEKRKLFLSILATAYQQRRKSIVGVLSRIGVLQREKVEAFLEKHNLAPSCRPDELRLQQWIELLS